MGGTKTDKSRSQFKTSLVDEQRHETPKNHLILEESNKHTPSVETRSNVGYPGRVWPTLHFADQGSETREVGRDDHNQSWLNDLFKTAQEAGGFAMVD